MKRRTFLEILGLTGGAMVLKQSLWPNEALAAPSSPQFLVVAYFGGGWDQLLALDPRDQTDARFVKAAAYAKNGSGIYPAYDEAALADAALKQTMGLTPVGSGGARTGVQSSGQLTFGPAVPQTFLTHAGDFNLVRGVTMDTLTHQVGMRYFLTGKFPRGLAPNGSSIGTVVAGQQLDPAYNLPNLVVGGVEAYNESWPAAASPIPVKDSADLRDTLAPKGTALKPFVASGVASYELTADSCAAHGYDMSGLVSMFRDSRQKAKQLTDPTLVNNFNFSNPQQGTSVYDLLNHMDMLNPPPISTSPKWRAAVAAQALTTGVSQAVAVQLVSDLDDHFDWAGNQSVSQRSGWDALGALINHLKLSPPPAGSTKPSFWDHTTLVVFSEFARTPLLNGRDGRDHHLANSCLIAGPGLKRGLVFGGTSDQTMAVTKRNFGNNAEDPTSAAPRPSDVHATVLTSMGLDTGHLSNQSPKLISYLIK
ncbi:MAG: DUF1501 domain-containing protein [Myxococcaceae bacterium]